MQQLPNSQINKFARLTAFLIMVAGLACCGLDRTPHYPDKTFGQGHSPTDNTTDQTTDQATDADGTGRNDTPTTPENTTLGFYSFNGYFDLDSVVRMLRGDENSDGQVSEGGITDSLVATALSFIIGDSAEENLAMRVQQTTAAQNSVSQNVHTAGGDAISHFKGEGTQSGMQYLDWALNQEGLGVAGGTACPKPFVCISRMVWRPVSGETMTYCYRDHASKKPMVIPYSANSNFTAEAFKAAIGNGYASNPIEVITHPGEVACDDTDVETRDINLVTYNLTVGNSGDQDKPDFLRRAIHSPLKADNEIVIEFALYDAQTRRNFTPKTGPYIDQRTRLNSKMRFFTSSADHVIVKIERTVTSPLKLEPSQIAEFIRNSYGNVAGSAVDYLTPKDFDMEGIQLRYYFEFCTHLAVVQNPINHCTGKTQP